MFTARMDGRGAMYTLNSTEVHAVCIGVDLYNQTLTGGVAKTLNSIRDDADHVPCVLIYDARGNGGVAYAQQSREITKTE